MFAIIIFILFFWFISEAFTESNSKTIHKIYMNEKYWTVWNKYNIVPNSFTRWYYKKKYRAEVDKLIEEDNRRRSEELEKQWESNRCMTPW